MRAERPGSHHPYTAAVIVAAGSGTRMGGTAKPLIPLYKGKTVFEYVLDAFADCPVIAVPTSVGYGAAFGGLATLLSMLNSCASGVSVVNIDNGFGAGYLASMINHMRLRRDRS